MNRILFGDLTGGVEVREVYTAEVSVLTFMVTEPLTSNISS